MAVITFNNKISWLVSSWAFSRLFEDICSQHTIDCDMKYKFDQAIALDGLHFERIDPNLRNRILRVMQESIEIIINDTSLDLKGSLDIDGYRMYREALPQLLHYIKQYKIDLGCD
jgi:hypothetical protein